MIKVLSILWVAAGFAWGIPSQSGEMKVISKDQKTFTVEQGGYRLIVNKAKLPAALAESWNKSIGRTFTSSVPYLAIAKETKIKGYKAPVPKDR